MNDCEWCSGWLGEGVAGVGGGGRGDNVTCLETGRWEAKNGRCGRC